jgi:hypothetical protein
VSSPSGCRCVRYCWKSAPGRQMKLLQLLLLLLLLPLR